ncbi:MAG: TolC family protein [Nitrospira sp.]|nr:TolC family protein [Nitrospira sp.]
MHQIISRYVGIVAFAMFWLGPSDPLPAQATDTTEPVLELVPLIQEAIQQNPEIAATQEQVLAMKERAPQVGALTDPELKVQLWNTPDSLNVTKTQTVIYGVTQQFPFPGLLSKKAEVATREAAQAEQRVAAKIREITAAVKMAFFELLFAHKAIEVHHEQQKLLRQFFDIANAKYGVGTRTQVDVLRAQVELSKISQQLPVLNQRRETAQAHLNTILDRDPQAPLGIPRAPRPQPLTYSLEELQEHALRLRPELQEADLAVTRFQSATQLAKLQYYPHLRVELQRWQNYHTDDGFGGNVMVNIPFAFWTKPKYDAGVREAAAQVRSAQAKQQTLVTLTRFQVKDLVVQIQATQEVLELYRTTIIPQSQQVLQAAHAGYRTDRTDFLDLIDAERALITFRLEYIRALVNREQQVAQLERVLGADL